MVTFERMLTWRHEIAEAVENGDNNLCMDCGHSWEAKVAFSCPECGGDGEILSELEAWNEELENHVAILRAEAATDRIENR